MRSQVTPMPKPEPSRLEALDALIAEKRKHEGYLEKLEGRKASTPGAVYARLRDEYLTKLTDLQVRAAEEAEALAANVREDEAAVAEIEERLNAATEERVEGELRAEVGEYEPKEWAKKLEVMNATINKIERELEARSSVLEKTRALLAEATSTTPTTPTRASTPQAASPAAPAKRGTPAATSPVAEQASPPRAAAPKAPEPVPAKETTKEEPKPAPTPVKGAPPIAGGPSFDELAFLNSVVGRVSTPVKVDPPAPVPRSSRPVSEIKESPSAPSPAPKAPAEPANPAAGEPPKGTPRPTTAKAPSPAEDEPPSALGRPTPRTSQAVKTLKCQECGTLNYPTEWYCERCGGELAAL
jgi:hypothetical protein